MKVLEIGKWSFPEALELGPISAVLAPAVADLSRCAPNDLSLRLAGAQATLRLGSVGLCWERHPDHFIRVAVYVPAKGSGYLELLLCSKTASFSREPLLTSSPYSRAAADWFEAAGARLAQLLNIPHETTGCADA